MRSGLYYYKDRPDLNNSTKPVKFWEIVNNE